MKRITTWLIAGVFGLLVCALGFSYLQYREAVGAADRAASQAIEVQRLSAQVSALTDRPTTALTERSEVQQISVLVENTAIACGIQQDSLKRIDAQDARRIGQTPYYRLPTRVTVEDAEMPQIIEMLSRLTQTDRLKIEDCRFFAPHSELIGRSWNAEFTLAYLVYDPEQDRTKP